MGRVPFCQKIIEIWTKTFLPCLCWDENEREFYIEMLGVIQYLDIFTIHYESL